MSGDRQRWTIGARIAARTAVAFAESVWDVPAAEAPVPVSTDERPFALTAGRPFRVLCWNVQFCAGRGRHFFYDGGPDVHVPPAEVWPNVDAIAAVIRDERPDVVLLQEVDRRSDRTGRIDQHAELLERAPFPCHTSVPYHRSRYVPHPPRSHLGRIDLHLSIFSRFPIVAARRLALASQRSASFVRRAFDLRRAILEADLALTDGSNVRVGNLHLTAFSGGDGTLPQQVGRVHDRLSIARAQGIPAILAGDFNALPPDDDPLRLGAAARDYLDDRDVLGPLFDTFRAAIPREVHRDEPERFRTYLPFRADAPDRALDHAFATGLDVLDVAVLTAHRNLSDHLPLRIEVQVSPRA